MARNLKIRDLTLRDGQQSSFATRMNQEQIDRCLPFYKDANFYAMEVWGGAVPDSVMRYLDENPWTRLETIHKAVGDVSKLTALSRGRNLFGYSPYTDEIIDGFCRNSIRSGLGIMRIFDALNDVDNVKSTVKYVKQYGGIADCAVCYTVDPKYPEPGFWARLTGKSAPKPVFTDAYFLDKARQMAALGADMITIKDMSGLIPPRRVATLVRLLKKNLSVPVDFHTHCTPGYGLASVLSAIIAGVDVVDTNCWYFAEGTGAPAIELIHVFCKKLGIETDVNMEAVAKINTQLRDIRKELNQSVFGVEKPEPKAFNPVTDTLPTEIDALFDRAIAAAQHDDENATIDACRKICILADMMFGKNVDPARVSMTGISTITAEDAAFAESAGMKLKLLGRAIRQGAQIAVFVSPHFVAGAQPLAPVSGVLNAIEVLGNNIGNAMFFGPGAGGPATASAVLGDVVDIVRNPGRKQPVDWSAEPADLTDPDAFEASFFLRTKLDKAACEQNGFHGGFTGKTCKKAIAAAGLALDAVWPVLE